MTDVELDRLVAKMERDISGHQSHAKREFGGTGRRRTAPAVAAEAARDISAELRAITRWRAEKGARQ